ncbi:MAG: hypothetical protein KC553_06605 [Nitrospina sp.]|nr:hypothetical protein [Nitrospina sp.]
MPTCVVVGGSGVMGQAAIQAYREFYSADARIVANWYAKSPSDEPVAGADVTIFGDITSEDCMQEIEKAAGKSFDHLFYATALGAVGFPIQDSTPEQIAQSNQLSFDPMPVLEKRFDIGTIVGYSTFYKTRHQLGSYGAMGYSKEAIEKWTLEKGKSRRACIRAGLFESFSSRGIKLLLRKTARDTKTLPDPLIQSYFEGVTTSEGVEKFLQGIVTEERELFGDSPTQPENLKNAHLELFKAESPAFVNVCGAKIWLSEEAQLLDSPA